MVRVMYNTQPLGMCRYIQKLVSDDGFVCTAICATEHTIIHGLSIILYSLLKKYNLTGWILADDSVMTQLKEHIVVEQYKKELQLGFLRYSLPEVVFTLEENNISYLMQNFDQYSSLKIYAYKKVITQSVEHSDNINLNMMSNVNNCELVINKSGDEDELEFISRFEKINEIVDVFLNLDKDNI